MISGAMCLVLPALFVGVMLMLGASGPMLVLAATAGAAIGVAWARRSWSHMFDENVKLSIEHEIVESTLKNALVEMSFRERFDNSLRSSTDESTTIELTLRAVAEVLPDADVSLLLNLPNEPRIGWTVRLVRGHLEPAVPMPDTPSCLALANLATTTTSSTRTLDACGHLRDQPNDVSSVCIPLRLGDRTLGSVNALCAPGEPPDVQAIQLAEWSVSRAAVRIAEQRLQRGPSLSGAPDPVTGLPGVPALRHQLKDLIRTLVPFCVAAVSVDHFEGLRYGEGTEASEIVLSFVADALTSTLRPGDFVCRTGGGNFAVVLADCNARQATAVIERVRESLALLLALESTTAFTFSAGIVESHHATSLDELLEMAWKACEQATAAGGNRVSLAFEADHI